METDSLYQLVYTSQSALEGTTAENLAEIGDILVEARNNNVDNGITGALAFSETLFAQVLEGTKDRITSLYDKLAQDPRHTNLRLIEITPIEERTFGDWSMAYVGDHQGSDTDFMVISAVVNDRSPDASQDRELSAQIVDAIIGHFEFVPDVANAS